MHYNYICCSHELTAVNHCVSGVVCTRTSTDHGFRIFNTLCTETFPRLATVCTVNPYWNIYVANNNFVIIIIIIILATSRKYKNANIIVV